MPEANDPAGQTAAGPQVSRPAEENNIPAGEPSGSEVLSQSEVESLLAQVAGQENGGSSVQPANENAALRVGGVQPYDFRQPVLLSPGELRRLRRHHEEFIRALGARLSIYMRLEFGLQLAGLQTIPYRKFVGALPKTTHLSLFKVEPLRGIGIIDIPLRLGLTLVDRLLGGPAQSITTEHAFSEIELALLDQVVQLVLSEWCRQWSSLEEGNAALLGHETNAQFLQTAPPDTLMLVLAMEARLGECVEPIQLAFPCSALEALIRKLSRATELVEDRPRLPAAAPKWNRNLDDVPVPVTAIWDDLTLSAREVANLKPGDIVPLDPRSARQVKLRLADVPKFQGSLGTAAGKWAVAVSEVLRLP
jgi:flagellar motor switch protein FliM